MDYNDKIADAVEAVEQDRRKEEITLTSGIILGLKKIPVLRIQSIVDKFSYPNPPKVPNEEKGRDEENPNDPNYVKACQEIDAERTYAILDAIVAFGTYIKYIPDGFPKPEEDSWVEELELLGVCKVPTESVIARYLFWAKYTAIVDSSDWQQITDQFSLQMGISHQEVNEHLRSSFPDQPTE